MLLCSVFQWYLCIHLVGGCKYSTLTRYVVTLAIDKEFFSSFSQRIKNWFLHLHKPGGWRYQYPHWEILFLHWDSPLLHWSDWSACFQHVPASLFNRSWSNYIDICQLGTATYISKLGRSLLNRQYFWFVYGQLKIEPTTLRHLIVHQLWISLKCYNSILVNWLIKMQHLIRLIK